jgi:hypothetical protein
MKKFNVVRIVTPIRGFEMYVRDEQIMEAESREALAEMLAKEECLDLDYYKEWLGDDINSFGDLIILDWYDLDEDEDGEEVTWGLERIDFAIELEEELVAVVMEL